MFFNLAFKNVKKSIKDFTIYFLTLSFGVCLFYLFNSIESQQAMLVMSEDKRRMMGALTQAIAGVSVFISVILAFLIIYANRFLIKRRKKELGLYMLLGMEKGKISRILIAETLFIGIFALGVGLLVGIVASQGLSVLTAKLFSAKMDDFQFVFSGSAGGKTVLYFGIMFVIIMIFNSVSVSRFKLIDLLSASKKNETLKVKNLGLSVVLFLLSVLCLGFAYYMIIKNGMLEVNSVFWGSIALGIIGTFLFFLSLSGFLLRVVKLNKKFYYRGLNMFVLRQINSKITTTFVSMTVICLMLLMAIGTLSVGAGFAHTMNTDLERATPYDVTVRCGFDSQRNPQHIDLAKRFQEDGIDLDALASSYAQIDICDIDANMKEWFTYEEVSSTYPLMESMWEDDQSTEFDAVRLSEYNATAALLGEPPLTLDENECAITCSLTELNELYQKRIDEGRTLSIGGQAYQVYDKVLDFNYMTGAAASNAGTLVVPDDLLPPDAPLSDSYFNLQYNTDDMEQGDQAWDKAMEIYSDNNAPFYTYYTKFGMQEQNAGLGAVVSYLAIYIGAVFLITCAAVLALQQLSESSDNVERYALLRKIGVEEKLINRSVFHQILIYFLMPLLLAIVHSVVGISVANNILKSFGQLNALNSIVSCALVLLVIYGAYLLATYLGSKSMIKSKRT